MRTVFATRGETEALAKFFRERYLSKITRHNVSLFFGQFPGAILLRSLMSLEEFFCRHSNQFLAPCFAETQQYGSSTPLPLWRFEELDCRKCKVEDNRCRKLTIAEAQVKS